MLVGHFDNLVHSFWHPIHIATIWSSDLKLNRLGVVTRLFLLLLRIVKIDELTGQVSDTYSFILVETKNKCHLVLLIRHTRGLRVKTDHTLRHL